MPTRPKRDKSSGSDVKSEIVSAKRTHTGMMEIISLARYLLATNGQSLPEILAWQYNHPLPYEDGITEDVYHNLFVQLGTDENLQ